MTNEAANTFIDTICQGRRPADQLVKGAINVVTHETMRWAQYRTGAGRHGEWSKEKAMYPWSVVEGYCHTVLNNTWVTDRDVEYGPWENNTSLLAGRIPMAMDFVHPQTTGITTLPSWIVPRSCRLAPLMSDCYHRGLLMCGSSFLWETARPTAVSKERDTGICSAN
jgi:hypothetical protein